MIDVHVFVGHHGTTTVQLGFTKAGEPFDSNKAETREFKLASISGPLLKMNCRDGSLLMWKDGCEMGGCSHFHQSSVTQLFWADRDTIAFLDAKGCIDAQLRDTMTKMSQNVRTAKPVMDATAMLMTAMLRGATLTPFYDQTPMARLFGTTPPVLAGYTLVLPDSPERHFLGVDDGDLPVLSTEARQAVSRFLGI